MKQFVMAAMAAAAVLLAGSAGGEVRLTGIGFAPGAGTVTVRGTGEAGAQYQLQWSQKLGAEAEWLSAGVAQAGADGAFEAADGACAGPRFYRVAGAEEASPEYVVVDLSAGTNAVYWPVSVMKSTPEGGWTDEYKTSKLVLRRIPAGSFMMGSPEDELGHQTNEVLHEVTLTEAFYMGVFEVTQKQYETVMGSNPSSVKGNTRPVEGVTYRILRGGCWVEGAGRCRSATRASSAPLTENRYFGFRLCLP